MTDQASTAQRQPRTIVWRHLYRERLRWAIPNLLIEESSDRVVTLLVPGTLCKAPTSYGRTGYVQQLLDGWEVGDFVWHTRRSLMLAPRDAAHTISLHWEHATDTFLGWYVNLQEPPRPTPIGYDTLDQMLDIWIEPDGSWRWKDWDELIEAERVGIFTHAQAEAILAEGQHVIDSLNTLLPTGWEAWQPDPDWPLPTVPAGWDRM
jgi:predicted RNA-binding protein associated with RNAse of E/G family